jgi:CRISPR/Cas system type I-B associated protein Csh2 (Cas7 group RAMP superfamily)
MLSGLACLALGLIIVTTNGPTAAAQKDGPKYTIPEVMKKAHSGKMALLNKVKSGTATDAEAKDLLEMYQALAKNKPPMGDDASWKKRTEALLEGAKLYVDGKKDDGKSKLNTAANCTGCHKIHKG